jgi:hypothetical protein
VNDDFNASAPGTNVIRGTRRRATTFGSIERKNDSNTRCGYEPKGLISVTPTNGPLSSRLTSRKLGDRFSTRRFQLCSDTKQ